MGSRAEVTYETDVDKKTSSCDIGKNVSFGLKQFEREALKERIARMFAALSFINEAIMRASTREELYQFVCDTMV